jgi:YesN/AraC family two-component response regulator
MVSGELYTVLVVDDEKWAVLYLKSLFNRPDLGFQVIAACRHPAEAIAVLEKEKPDVLITDISMPEINGIQLIDHVRHADIPCEAVIISGFSEFSFARQAISLGVFEYIVKPATAQNATDVLTRLRKKLESKKTVPVENENQKFSEDDSLFSKLLQYITQHYNHRLYLNELADQFGLTPNYCCTLFSKIKGMTFSQYVTDLRMAKAASLLKYPDLSINKIALMVGFDDYTYFNKIFKRIFQCTPTEFRKREKINKDYL